MAQYFSMRWPFSLFVVAWVSIALTALQVLVVAAPENQVYSSVLLCWLSFLYVALAGGACFMVIWNLVKVWRDHSQGQPYKERESKH